MNDQSKTKPIKNDEGFITNAIDLTIDDVAMQNILCPLCEHELHGWSQGWDSHAEHVCSNLSATDPKERKAEYKEKLRHLFR